MEKKLKETKQFMEDMLLDKDSLERMKQNVRRGIKDNQRDK
jgi:hypothetical protein